MRLHVSIDDVFPALVYATDTHRTLFEQPFFAMLAQLHAAFDAKVTLYVFLRGVVDGQLRHLEELPARFQEEFAAASWLRLAPHGLDYDTPPFRQSVADVTRMLTTGLTQLDRLAGPGARATWWRLHYFSECYEQQTVLTRAGITTLLLTDKESVSYRLPPAAQLALVRDGMTRYEELDFVRSAPRLEFLARDDDRDTVIDTLQERLQRHGTLAIFTHECEMQNPAVMSFLRRCLARFAKLGIEYVV